MTTSPTILPTRRLARIIFTSFLFTFIAARLLVILIMTRRLPDLFLHLGETHVHHLNYGIFLLSVAGGLLVFVRAPSDRLRQFCALLYGVGMALTFDEFGMWLHLGGSYWQRASFDAVIVLLSLFGVIAFAPDHGADAHATLGHCDCGVRRGCRLLSDAFPIDQLRRKKSRPEIDRYRGSRAALSRLLGFRPFSALPRTRQAK